jgi:uncharacterized protein YqjF (DUF2071 family)
VSGSIAPARPFLDADWRYLAMLNFAADPALLASFVPDGTELDYLAGRTFLSASSDLCF